MLLDNFDHVLEYKFVTKLMELTQEQSHDFSIIFVSVWAFVCDTLHDQALTCNFTKITLLHGCFSSFLNCTKSTKSCNTSQIWKYS